MSLSNSAETGILELIFENDDTNAVIAALGDGLVASTTAGSLHVSLHTGDPGEAGDQTTNEVTTGEYDNYSRQAVARSAAGWTVSGSNCSNAAVIAFTAGTGGTGANATHFAIGTAASGAGNLLCTGALDATLAVGDGVTPTFAIGALDIDAD